MIIGIIQNDNKKYYIKLVKQYNESNFYVYHYTNNRIVFLSKEDISLLLKDIFTSDNFVSAYKDDEYDVYLDEKGNKRFFKSGKEDIQKFFLENGIAAVMFKSNDSSQFENIKKYIFNVGGKITVIVGLTLLLSLFSGCGLTNKEVTSGSTNYTIASNAEFDSNKEELTSPPVKIDANFIIKLIMENMEIEYGGHISDKDLNWLVGTTSEPASDELKDYICNENLISDILQIKSEEEKQELKYRFYKLIIRYACPDVQEDMKKRNISGFVIPLYQNTIVLYSNDEEHNTKILPHEFVHTWQSFRYAYIIEAVAESMAAEYYEMEIAAYKDVVLRVQVLMEIIGPKPIMEAAFKDDANSFEEDIKKLLGAKESEELLSLFEKAPNYNDDLATDNKRVDELLAVMYCNKYGKNIKDNRLIQYMYETNQPLQPNERSYFNQRLTTFKEPTIIDTTNSKVYIDNIDRTSMYYYWTTKRELKAEEVKPGTSCVIYTMPVAPYEWDGEKYYNTNNPDDCIYSKEEALEKGAAEKKYYAHSFHEGTYEDLLNSGDLSNKMFDSCYIALGDDTIYLEIDSKGEWHFYKKASYNFSEQSIKEKFPKHVKEIEEFYKTSPQL